MPSSSIAQILLRLFALHWLLIGVIQLVSVAFLFREEYFTIFSLGSSVSHFVAGALVWIIAPRLSRALARGNDREPDLRGLSEQQLYAAVFLGLGLYFTLTSFGEAFGWIHFFAVNRSSEHGFHQGNQPSYYDMSESVMTLAAGILLITTCKTWARKLARKHPSEPAGNGTPDPGAS